MQSEFDTLVEDFLSPMMLHQFGRSQSIRIIPSGPAPEVVIDAILSTPTIALLQDPETGEIIRREQCTAIVERCKIDPRNIGCRLGLDAKIVESQSGQTWNWDQDATEWGAVLVKLGMIRKPLVRKQEPHRAGL